LRRWRRAGPRRRKACPMERCDARPLRVTPPPLIPLDSQTTGSSSSGWSGSGVLKIGKQQEPKPRGEVVEYRTATFDLPFRRCLLRVLAPWRLCVEKSSRLLRSVRLHPCSSACPACGELVEPSTAEGSLSKKRTPLVPIQKSPRVPLSGLVFDWWRLVFQLLSPVSPLLSPLNLANLRRIAVAPFLKSACSQTP